MKNLFGSSRAKITRLQALMGPSRQDRLKAASRAFQAQHATEISGATSQANSSLEEQDNEMQVSVLKYSFSS